MTTFWPEPLVVTTRSATWPGPAATAGMTTLVVPSEMVLPDEAGTVAVPRAPPPATAKATCTADAPELTAWPTTTASAPALLEMSARSAELQSNPEARRAIDGP